jgi:Double zinc ribbon
VSAAVLALVVGTLLAVGALAFVLYPLFFASGDDTGARAQLRAAARNDAAAERSTLATDLAVVALREIEFDRATGKLSEADYAQLKERYTQAALAAMRDADSVSGTATAAAARPHDAIEAAVRAYRETHPECPSCGPRPESDAVFCSTCGRYLLGRCIQCGARVEEIDARYCAACGTSLAA